MRRINLQDRHETGLDYEVVESWDGEIRDLILQNFIDDGELPTEMHFVEDNVIIMPINYLSDDEIFNLHTIELSAGDEFWDTVTLESLKGVLRAKDGK